MYVCTCPLGHCSVLALLKSGMLFVISGIPNGCDLEGMYLRVCSCLSCMMCLVALYLCIVHCICSLYYVGMCTYIDSTYSTVL